MAVHLPCTPENLEFSECYKFLIEDFEKNKIDTWSLRKLQLEYGVTRVQDIIDEGFLVKHRNDTVQLSFNVLGTTPNLVKNFCKRDMYNFVELIKKFPKVSRCSGMKMRNYLVFLCNFGCVQTFTLPASALTFVAKEGDKVVEKRIDKMFSLSGEIERKFLFRIDLNETVSDSLQKPAFRKVEMA